MKRIITYSAFILLIALSACSKKDLASVGDRMITEGELNRQMMRMDPEVLQRLGEKELKKILLERMIENELLYQDLLDQKYDTGKEIAARWEEIKPDVEMTYFVNEYIRFEAPLSSKKLKAAYEERIDQFTTPEKVKASHILVSTGEKRSAETARAQIEEIQKKLKAKEKTFSELAEEYSECPSSSRGGDLGWFSRGQMVPSFEEAAFSMKKGDISTEPVLTQFGLHLIQITDRQAEGKIPFKEAQFKLKEDVYNTILKEEYKIAVYPEKASLKPSTDIVGEIQSISYKYTNEAFLNDLSRWMNQKTMEMLFKNADALYGTINDLIIRKAYRSVIDEKALHENENYHRFMEQGKRQFLVQNYLEEMFFKDIKTTPEEMRNLYENNPELMQNLARQYGERFLKDASFRHSKEKEFFPYLEQEIVNTKKEQIYHQYINTLKNKYPVEVLASFD